MKTVIALIIGIILGVFVLPRLVDHLFLKLRASNALGNCRDLSLAVHGYILDYESTYGNKPTTIPSMFEVIDEKDLRRIERSRGVYLITYSPEMRKNDILVQWVSQDYTAFIRKGGEGHVMHFEEWTKHRRAEQGAAANP